MGKKKNVSIEGIRSIVEDYLRDKSRNNLKNDSMDKAWDEPLVGFSSGADPFYKEFKEHVGPFHWTPLEIFNKTYPPVKVSEEELTIISWVLPQTEKTRSENRKQTIYPSESWARARIYGEEVNIKLRTHVTNSLKKAGIEAVAPMISEFWQRKTSDRFGFASTWSERHIAHASGLGTFGLCDGLITPLGKAVRLGSVVARTVIQTNSRPYIDHRAYCFFYPKGLCGKCIKRCPVKAIDEMGHNKERCSKHIRTGTARYVKEHYEFDGYGCGLCQTGVPCEFRIPKEEDL